MAQLTEQFFSDGELDTTVYYNGNLTTVYVTDRLTGLTAKGNAKHHPDDQYDQNIGYTLAVCRALSRLYKKIEKDTIKFTQ